jgi:hypothetical protein
MPPHIVVTLSAHGYGHGAQTIPVLDAMAASLPDFRLTVRGGPPATFWRQRASDPVLRRMERRDDSLDVGMRMVDALQVDWPASWAAYRAFHGVASGAWSDRVATEVQRLEALKPDLLLSNVPYLPLAAAERIGLPAFALCSLNWADILAHYGADQPEARAYVDTMRAAYASAEVFFRPEPAMPMADLPNTRAVGPIARGGQDRRSGVLQHLGLEPSTRLVLVALGGIPTQLDLRDWPRQPGTCWLVPPDWPADPPAIQPWERTGAELSDLLASCDVVLTKPGYGTFVEAAAVGTRVLSLERPDWPESPYLEDWIRERVPFTTLTPADLTRDRLRTALDEILARPTPDRPWTATGATEVADSLITRLTGHRPAR